MVKENGSGKRELATGRVYADLATAIADRKKPVATGVPGGRYQFR